MDADILVVGGGVAGLSVAAELAAHASVVLLEAEASFGHHASGRSAALFEPRYGAPVVRALNEATGPGLAARGVLSPRGMMLVGLADERDIFERDVRQMGLARLPLEDARARVPALSARVSHAAHNGAAQDIDTDALLASCRKAAREHGADLRTGAPVSAIARTDTGWRVEAPAGSMTARVVVNAAGAWADGIATMAGVAPLGLTPLRRSVARVPAPAGHDVRGWPMLMGPGEGWYAKPDAGAMIVSPADEHPVEPHDAWAEDETLAEGIARYEAALDAPVTRLLASWAGLRTFAPDRVLVIGRDPAAPGFFWLAGQGGYGYQTSLAAARLAADLLLARPPELAPATVAALSPGRFV